MYKSNIEICMVITNEVATEIKETIGEALVNAAYKVNRYQTIEEFLAWYEGHPLEVCLITNESIKSESYTKLKKQHHQLKDIILVEPSDEISTIAEHNVYMDSKNGEINMNDLLQAVEFAVEQLEISMYDSDLEEDNENEMDDTHLQSESTISNNEAEGLQTDPPLAGEKRNKNRSDLKESPDKSIKTSEKLEQESPTPKAEEDKNEEVESKEPIDETALKNDIKAPLQNSPVPMRMRNIQKSLSGLKIEKNKTIGVWSPLPAVGVTSFLINFSLFLSENKVHTAVLEGLSSNYILKDWLKQYSSIPDKWVSLASNLHAAEPVGNGEWLYRGVKFFPIHRDDLERSYTPELLKAYNCMTEIYDVTLVDMPSREMHEVTAESLKYMDELWIIACDRYLQLHAWKDYIKKIEETHSIPVYLIHNQMIDASKPKLISELMELPMLATIPALWEETAKNYYQKKPLYFQRNVQPILEPHYLQLATHLIGSSFQLQGKKLTLWEQIIKITTLPTFLNR